VRLRGRKEDARGPEGPPLTPWVSNPVEDIGMEWMKRA
jgi:hypothetical protein